MPEDESVRWSRGGLGTAPLGSRAGGPLWWGRQDRALSVRTVQAAIDAGVTWIDTAPFYGWGLAEEIVGDAVTGCRDAVVVLTKCGTVERPGPGGGWYEDASPAAVRADVEASLRRLRTDRIDVVQLHDPDPRVPIEETVGALATLVDEGLVASIGLSNHPVELLVRGASVAPIAVVQHQWSLLHHDAEAEGAAAWAESNGARFLGWSPLASGFLADGFDITSLHPDDLRRRLPWANGDGADRVARLRAVAASLGTPLERLALAWAARRCHPIIGARTPAEAVAIATVQPLDDERAFDLEGAAAA